MKKGLTLREYFCLHRKFLVFNLIARNLKIRYRKSFFGMIWTVLIPAGTACIYYFVFNYIFKVRTENYLFLILCGLIPWTFFISTASLGIESLVGNVELLNKVPLPLPALPLSETLTQFLNLVLSTPVLIIGMILLDVPVRLTAIQYPFLLALLFIIAHSISLIVALLYVYFRDLKHLMGLILQFWFYLTPIMYSASMIPEKFKFVVFLNPLACIFLGIHAALIDGQWINSSYLLAMGLWSGTLLLASWLLLRKLSDSITESI